MDIGMIGLGRMGAGMTMRWLGAGHRVVAYDLRAEVVEQLASAGAVAATSVANLVEQLAAPRAIWVMLPAGKITSDMISTLMPLLAPGDTIIDGGNTYFREDQQRARSLGEHGIHYVDQGTSGGVWGETEGYCLMVGGEAEVVKRLEPAFLSLVIEQGFAYVGPVGAGHFTKMVHNGIEYGMMQAYAEGFALMQAMPDFQLDLGQLAQLWNHGSVIRSWLLELVEHALVKDPQLEHLQAYVEDSGEGRWMAQAAIEAAVPLPVITLSLMQRFASRQDEPFSDRLLAALRNEFGGHAVRKTE